jgi:hypothetical protein
MTVIVKKKTLQNMEVAGVDNGVDTTALQLNNAVSHHYSNNFAT